MINMKFSIISSEEYPHHELIVPDWIAKKGGYFGLIKSKVLISDEKDAYEIQLKSGKKYFIPKNRCKIIERKESSLFLWTKSE